MKCLHLNFEVVRSSQTRRKRASRCKSNNAQLNNIYLFENEIFWSTKNSNASLFMSNVK